MSTRDKSPDLTHAGRRRFLIGTSATVAGALLYPDISARAADTLTVADPGGPYGTAFTEAFYAPFNQLGIAKVTNVARVAEPTSQIKAMVEAKSFLWDVVSVSSSSHKLLSSQGLLDPLDWTDPEMQKLIPAAHQPDWMGTNVYGTVLAFRTDKMTRHPQSWADFYNVKDFPGRRALPKSPITCLEGALLADGVSAQQLYPLDVDRAFRKLDTIKPHVTNWWTSYGQTTQLLQTGEIDFLATSNARVQAAIDSGAPVKIIWNQGLYGLEGWAIPKGSPKAALAKKFIASCANGHHQAAYTKLLAYGPTNPSAFDLIPAQRAAALPTFKDNFAQLTQIDDSWWGANKDKIFDRFNAWLLR
ncbi:ABC transporter substrate-binding protein [Paraburkholderia domus]|uniref:ABC transporter substrate-binding protein n=1 Tax=Paraburkholderia domus TaxID=2793075 RepID=UPI001913B681|nr:ABC transporter substrate-binding protein [Paraburkholderia domus]MBK5065903.1 ABC transporter substrate-binding protein [Burkholderia sp. R-70199]CAE6959272.1 hypothetical protein R70199_07189 [Paraburkholderia domus]